jgi:hypothetical protein
MNNSVIYFQTTTVATAVVRPYLTYLNFGQMIALLFFQMISISTMTYLVYCAIFNKDALKVRRLSDSLMIFLVTHIVLSITAVPYGMYVVLFWSPGRSHLRFGYTDHQL